MSFKSSFELREIDVDFYYKLLSEEDFDFKTKQISVSLQKLQGSLNITIDASSFIDCKIGTTAVLKSLEIIQKTNDL